MKTITEHAKTLKLKHEYDVIAVGGGIAGVAAAAMTDDFSKLDVKVLQKHLCSQGVVLHWNDVKDKK